MSDFLSIKTLFLAGNIRMIMYNFEKRMRNTHTQLAYFSHFVNMTHFLSQA